MASPPSREAKRPGALTPCLKEVLIILKFVVDAFNPDGVSLDAANAKVACIKDHLLAIAESA